MIGWNWKEPRGLNIFDVIDCISDKIKKIFKSKPKNIDDSNTVILTTRREQILCSEDETHDIRYEYCKTSYGTLESSYYCSQCGKHYLRNEMTIIKDERKW